MQVRQLQANAEYLTGHLVETTGIRISFVEKERLVASTTQDHESEYQCCEKTTGTDLIFTSLKNNKMRFLVLKDGVPSELLMGYKLIVNQKEYLIDGKSITFELVDLSKGLDIYLENQEKLKYLYLFVD